MKKYIFLLSIILLAANVFGTNVTVQQYTIDSSTSNMIQIYGIPRHKMAILPENKHLCFIRPYWSGAGTGARRGIMFTPDVTAAGWSDRWTDYDTLQAAGNYEAVANHCHISICDGDTSIFMSNNYSFWRLMENADSIIVANRLSQLTSDELLLSAVNRIPGTDTLIEVSRHGDADADDMDISYRFSADLGANWSSRAEVIDMNVAGRRRIGLENFNNTVSLFLDSGNVKFIRFDWNRTTKAWDRDANLIANRSDLSRGYAVGIANDTTICFAVSNTDANADSLLISHKNLGDGAWTTAMYFCGSAYNFTSDLIFPAFTFIKSSGRLLLFFTRCDGEASTDSINIYMTYCVPPDWTWATPTKISRGRGFGTTEFVVMPNTAPFTPASHGDVAYCAYMMDTTISTTVYHYLDIAKITFTEDAPSNITHSLTATSKTSSSVTVEDIYSDGVGVDTVWLFYDDDATIAGADSTYDASSLGSPDTVTASGLSPSTEYHFWMVISEDNGRDTSSSITETTSATATTINRVRIRK